MHGTLFPGSKECVVDNVEARPLPNRDYVIGWIPARLDEKSTLLVYDSDKNTVVHFERTPAENQITRVRKLSDDFEAMVKVFNDGYDEAILKAAEHKGVWVRRIKFTPQERAAANENLGMLIRKRVISYPDIPELIAELDVFKSDFTYSGVPDYSLQVAQQSAIQALCLVTYKVDPEEPIPLDLIYYNYDPDLLDWLHGRDEM